MMRSETYSKRNLPLIFFIICMMYASEHICVELDNEGQRPSQNHVTDFYSIKYVNKECF